MLTDTNGGGSSYHSPSTAILGIRRSISPPIPTRRGRGGGSSNTTSDSCGTTARHRHSPKPQRALSGQGRKCPIINPMPTHPPKPSDPAQVPLPYGPACCNSKKGNPALCQTQLKAQPELHRITPFHQQIPGSSAFFHWDGARVSERAGCRPPSPQSVTSGVTTSPSSHHSFGKHTGST